MMREIKKEFAVLYVVVMVTFLRTENMEEVRNVGGLKKRGELDI